MCIGTVALSLLFLTIEPSHSEKIEAKNNESLLLNTLFKDYDKRARPVKNYHTPVVVSFGIELSQIVQVDEKRQVLTTNVIRHLRWNDEFLQWNPEIYENIANLSIHRDEIWTPDMQLFNSASYDDEPVQGLSITNIFVRNNGSVQDAMPMIVQSTCGIDVTWFPFDKQKCLLIFGSWTSSSKHLHLHEGGYDPLWATMENGEWSLLGVNFSSSFVNNMCCPDDLYFRITYEIHLKRRPLYYFFNLLIPCALIGFLAILGFTLPPESGEKLPLGATILFSLIVFLNMISESMPANSDAVPLLGTYFNCVMFSIALSVVSTIAVNVNIKSVNSKKVNGLTKKLFLRWLPRLLRMTIPSNVVAEHAASPNKKIAEDTITLHIHRNGLLETVVTHSLHADKIAAQQWSLVAAVVDRICLVFSVVVTLVSVTVFLVYAY